MIVYDCRCAVQEAVALFTDGLSGPLSVNEVIGLSDMMECPSPRLIQRIVNRYSVLKISVILPNYATRLLGHVNIGIIFYCFGNSH